MVRCHGMLLVVDSDWRHTDVSRMVDGYGSISRSRYRDIVVFFFFGGELLRNVFTV